MSDYRLTSFNIHGAKNFRISKKKILEGGTKYFDVLIDDMRITVFIDNDMKIQNEVREWIGE